MLRRPGIVSCSAAAFFPMFFALCTVQSHAQNTAPKAAPKAAAKAAPAAAPKKPRMSKLEVQELWKTGNQEAFIAGIGARGLAFEPEEDWVNQLPKTTGIPRSTMPDAAAALDKLIPPAPDPDVVAQEAPALLSKVKEAAQKRSEADLTPLVHPDLLADKAKVYDLFDTTNYRTHSLGRFASTENRRVGVQFFQLTNSHVERLHYVFFSISSGRLVVRDIVNWQDPAVSKYFLRDEEQLALSKLNLVFRALNEGDDTGLRNLCTPGLFASLKAKTGEGNGSLLTRGQFFPLDRISPVASVSLNQKSVRVVVRVSYPTGTANPLQYDIDFERIGNDLKVVRVRDWKGGVIAWDPDIDNYLNRRYELPDDPVVTNVVESDDTNFQPIETIRANAMHAVANGDAKKLKDYSDQLAQREPNSGEAFGIRATLQHLAGNYDEATSDARKAIEHGGTVYFDVLDYENNVLSQSSAPAILSISRGKIELRPIIGGQAEQIPVASVKADFDTPPKGMLGQLKSVMKSSTGPFLKVDSGPKSKSYKFAAAGTQCPDQSTARNSSLEQYPGGACGTSDGKNMINILVPHTWYQDLQVIKDTIEVARSPDATPKR